MVETDSKRDRFDWQVPLYVVLGASVALLSLMVYGPNADLLYILIIGPAICLACLILLLVAAFRKGPRQCLSLALTVVALLAASAALLKSEHLLRPQIRWLLWSRRYKAELLAGQNLTYGELRHMEWDSWGFVPSGFTVVYLVFDPADSLADAANKRKPGRFAGIPCEVPEVRRLERQWYFVTFYTDEEWGKCPLNSSSNP